MEQKVIMKESNKCIYLLRDNNISFYLIIPRSKEVNLVLGIFDNIDDNNVINIKNIPDKSIVVPIIDKNILEGAKTGKEECYKYIDNLFSILINTAYKILTYNKIEVNNKIILDYNMKYSSFNNWYIPQYKERIELIDLNLHPDNTIPKPQINDVKESRVLEDTLPDIKAKELNNNDILNNNKYASAGGFISYVLLGVIVAVISLVILYMLI